MAKGLTRLPAQRQNRAEILWRPEPERRAFGSEVSEEADGALRAERSRAAEDRRLVSRPRPPSPPSARMIAVRRSIA